jgi:hypothetical protein
MQSHIPRVRYASIDPFFDGMTDWFAEFGFTRERIPEREELGGRIGAFAHVLHVSWLALFMPTGVVIDAHRRLRPQHLDLALEVVRSERLGALAHEGGDVRGALSLMWDALGELTG